MKNYEIEPGEALNLFIVSDVATSGNVTIPGQGWSQAFTVAPNVTTTVTIPNNIAEVYDSQVVQGRGVRIETQDTVSVFAINFGPFTADGTKILPIPSLGTNYMVASYPGLSPWDSQLLIVATEDDTEVEIIPSAATSTGNAAGVPFTVSLDQGETYQ
ncbi:MAG: Ig-like domain-containing protein, partial [Bacteroidota bacterium]